MPEVVLKVKNLNNVYRLAEFGTYLFNTSTPQLMNDDKDNFVITSYFTRMYNSSREIVWKK